MNYKAIRLLVLSVSMLFQAKLSKASIGKQYFFELSPIYFLYQGGGGSIGSEKNHWQTGLAFSTFNPQNFYFEGKIDVTGSLKAIRATTFEPFTKFYFSKERKGVYLGLNLVPEFYKIKDEQTNLESMQINAYAKPKAGFRWFPFKKILYIDVSYAMSVRIVDTQITNIGQSSLVWRDFMGSPEASIGIRFK